MTEKFENLYTERDWEKDGTLKVQVGQIITPEVYFQLLGAVPPKSYGRVFQVGEAHSYDWERGVMLYDTFEHVGDNYYKYVGLRP